MPDDSIPAETPTESTILKLLVQIGLTFEISVEQSTILDPEESADAFPADPLGGFIASAKQSGIFIQETKFEKVSEAIGFVEEGYPVIIAQRDGKFIVIDSMSGKHFETTTISDQVKQQTISKRTLTKWIMNDSEKRFFVAKKELECDSLSAAHTDSHHDHPSEAISPTRRFIALLALERRDIWTVFLFAFVAGILTLATPLAVESLVNVVSWGTYLQPLLALGLILLTCLGIAGVLRVLQTVVVEMIQRRQFVRIVSDLSHRFPRANQDALKGKFPREFANRVFDIMTIQKSTAVLLLDGVSIVLTTILGSILLAFYHPFLLGFDIALLISMISITWVLGRGGIRTAIQESKIKYKVAHWLQDVLACPSVFKTGGGELLAVQRANMLTAEYLSARQRQFRVVLRQVAFAICLQVIASTALLVLGGWLVIDGQLTLGQLVASELVVTIVVGAFAKAGKSLEKFYDLMAGMDKVGQLIDIPTDPRSETGKLPDGPISVQWSDLVFSRKQSTSKIPAKTIQAGSTVAILGNDLDGKSDLARVVAGLSKPSQGYVQVGAYDSFLAAGGRQTPIVGYAGDREIFKGTLSENIDLGRSGIGPSHVREALSEVGLAEAILRLPDALQTPLQTDGYPLTDSQVTQLLIARAIVTKPKAIVINGLLDELTPQVRAKLWVYLSQADAPWTLLIFTDHKEIADLCDERIEI